MVTNPAQRVQITRADYEMRYGIRPNEMSIGAVIISETNIPLLQFVFMTTAQEVSALERLYAID